MKIIQQGQKVRINKNHQSQRMCMVKMNDALQQKSIKIRPYTLLMNQKEKENKA